MRQFPRSDEPGWFPAGSRPVAVPSLHHVGTRDEHGKWEVQGTLVNFMPVPAAGAVAFSSQGASDREGGIRTSTFWADPQWNLIMGHFSEVLATPLTSWALPSRFLCYLLSWVEVSLKPRSHIPTRLNHRVGSLSVSIWDRGLQQQSGAFPRRTCRVGKLEMLKINDPIVGVLRFSRDMWHPLRPDQMVAEHMINQKKHYIICILACGCPAIGS